MEGKMAKLLSESFFLFNKTLDFNLHYILLHLNLKSFIRDGFS